LQLNAELNLEHLEILHSLSAQVEEDLTFLTPIDKAWQPTDFLPDLCGEDFVDRLNAFRAPAKNLTNEILVVLVGGMITEEALPSYALQLNLIASDFEGNRVDAWSKWMRGWVAEENRHGDPLNAYLRLTGRVDMRAIELTVHHLIANGFNPATYPDPYEGLVYTSFQERATKISHGNVGKLAAAAGDLVLGKICQRIAGDESRHEAFYTRIVGHLFSADPNGVMLACRSMLRTVIAMPGRLMFDGKDANLFDHFAVVAQRSGVYTVHDYATIIEHLVKTWDIAGRSVSGAAARSQDWLCRQADRYLHYADQIAEGLLKQPPRAFSWIHDRKA
jgi:acyl-[acyl-carrier-protein] desaturase